jgi:hypothetical protein
VQESIVVLLQRWHWQSLSLGLPHALTFRQLAFGFFRCWHSAVQYHALGERDRGALVAVLMALNAVGAFGYLSAAHIGHAVAGEVTALGRAADVEARLSVQTGVVADFDRRIAQIDSAVEKTTAKGRTASAMSLAEQQREKARGDLVAERTGAAKALAGIQVEKAKTEGDRRIVEADNGPVRYLAALLGATDENVMRWFILVVALLLDPAAVLLLLAAARR